MIKKVKLVIIPIILLMGFYLTSSILSKYATTLPKNISLNITKVNYIAEVNGNFYYTLQEAIDTVPKNNTRTTVTLLADTTEAITILQNQDVVLNLQNFTVNNSTTSPTIKNSGTLKISNGTITNTSAATNSLIDNYASGSLEITGGQLISIGTKQAVYNEGGIVNISGSPYISSKATGTYDRVERATVQNRLSGQMTITGGTIVNNDGSAVSINTGTLAIGTKDDDPDATTVLIKGKTYGIYNYTGFKFYDGKIEGITDSIYNKNSISDVETGYHVIYGTETIDGKTYKTATLRNSFTVKFNGNGGTASETERYVVPGSTLGTLPTARRSDFVFDGWFTERTGGTQITASTVINGDEEFFAHWHQEQVAEISGTRYYSLQSAIRAVPSDNTETVITLLTNISENVTVAQNKNIVFDLQNYTISSSANSPIITNDGKIKIMNGTINQTISYAAINNETTGEIVMTGGTIISTGERAGIYNLGNGKVSISGNAYISSNAIGQYNSGGVILERATIMNVDSGAVVEITGGTIVGTASYSLSNKGTMTLGVKEDGIISTSDPSITGATYGIKNYNTFNYYDGIIRGINGTIDGTISDQEPNTQLISDTETIGGNNYMVNYLN